MSLELVYNCEKERIRRKEDAVICCLHEYLITNGLKCIGNGEEIVNPQTVRCSDMLPSGWNEGGDSYTLTYRQEGTMDIFLMKALNVDETVYIQLLRHRDEKITEIEVLSSQFTTADFKSSFDTAYKSLDDLKTRVLKELVGPFLTSPPKSQESAARPQATPPNRDPRDPLRVYRDDNPSHYRDPLSSYGRSDLDPLYSGGPGGHGGGMIFDPMRNQPGGYGQPNFGGEFGGEFGGHSMIPRGSVPPGARFDPIGPGFGASGGFDPRRSGPDPDHMPPPGFNDDMFM